MAQPLILYINHDRFIYEVKESITGFNFPWEITLETIKEENNAGEKKKQDETGNKNTDNARLREKLHQSADALIEAGSYPKALEILNKLWQKDPADNQAAEKIGQLESWIQTQKEIDRKLENDDYENAINLLEDLSVRVPVGEGQKRLLNQLNEIKQKRVNQLENLQNELNHTADISKQVSIIEKIIEIAPEDMARTFATKKEDLERKLEIRIKKKIERKEKARKWKLGLAIAAITALVIYFFVYPGIRDRIEMQFIRDNIETAPGKALTRINEKLEKKDTKELRRLKEKALDNVKTKKSMALIQKAKEALHQNKIEESFKFVEQAKKLFEGTALPQCVIEGEKYIKTTASDYYLKLARDETLLGQKYLYYANAHEYGVKKIDIFNEMKTFERKNKRAIVLFLLKQAFQALAEEKCEAAKYFIGLGFHVDPNNPQVLALREEIDSQCPNE